MTLQNPTYESLRDAVRSIVSASSDRTREVEWLESSKGLAASRDARGRLELFLICPRLTPFSGRVRDQMIFDAWSSSEGTTLNANRLVLAAGEEYDAAAALIAIELLQQGFSADPVEAFARAEPVIHLVLTEAQSENAIVTGLAGELQLLAALSDSADTPTTAALVNAWHGWDRSSRDFQFGPVGVEVKTTTTGTSTHTVQGWYQVEPGMSADGQVETTLHLLSLGIRWLDSDADRGVSVESLIKTIAGRLSPVDRADFLAHVRGFAGGQFSINEDGTADSASLRRPFMAVFERLYNLDDPGVQLPRSADLALFPHVDIDSVQFTAQLPERVRGDLNPVSGMQAVVTSLRHQWSL